MRKHLLNRLVEEEDGSSIIEFTISVTVLLMLLFGILDLSRALYIDHFVSGAAREGARYAMVRGSTFNNASCSTPTTTSCTATQAAVTSYVQSLAPTGVSTANLTVQTTWPGTSPSGNNCVSAVTPSNGPGCVVKVVVTDAFGFAVPYFPAAGLNLSSTATVAISQ
jgi:Flp pilus assembly protein TadG